MAVAHEAGAQVVVQYVPSFEVAATPFEVARALMSGSFANLVHDFGRQYSGADRRGLKRSLPPPPGHSKAAATHPHL